MAQPAEKALLRFESAAFSMGVNNHEQILVGTRVGEVAFNAFYFPWRITLNGATSTNTSIESNNFLNSVFPSFLDRNKRVEVIQDIVKELYRQQE